MSIEFEIHLLDEIKGKASLLLSRVHVGESVRKF